MDTKKIGKTDAKNFGIIDRYKLVSLIHTNWYHGYVKIGIMDT